MYYAIEGPNINMTPFKPFTLNIRGQLMRYERPLVMGILNVTPDSFYGDSRTMTDAMICRRVEQMVQEGADIIDVGGYSSRPGADDVPAAEELRRVALGLEAVHRVAPGTVTSVDTFRSDIAVRSVSDYGADIINDISGGDLDDRMFDTIMKLNVPYILMHMRGTPATMQSKTDNSATEGDVTAGVIAELSAKVNRLALRGVNDVIIDPGFGFSKDLSQNFDLLRNLGAFSVFDRPILVGVSRKSMIFKALGCSPADALNGTTVVNTMALERGASIIRVHDVRAARECVSLVGAAMR